MSEIRSQGSGIRGQFRISNCESRIAKLAAGKTEVRRQIADCGLRIFRLRGKRQVESGKGKTGSGASDDSHLIDPLFGFSLDPRANNFFKCAMNGDSLPDD